VLLALYCFFSLAVFTPLHTHSKTGSCTLNGFDHQWSDATAPTVAPWGLEQLSWWGHTPETLCPDTLFVAPHSSRAPPAGRTFAA
jgi:hypothetical protein